MKTIEERAKEYSLKDFDGYYTGREKALEEGYIAGAKEQKAIDDAEYINQVLMGKGSAINHYKQGYHDAIEKACNIFCHTGCPHKIDSYNCLNDKCDTWKIFRRMMGEEYENVDSTRRRQSILRSLQGETL